MSFTHELCKEFTTSKPKYTEKDYPDLSGKTFLVTGTSAGVGKSTVRLLLGQGARVVTVNRSPAKNEKALDESIHELIKQSPELSEQSIRERIITVEADLMDLATIKPASELIKQKVNQLDTVILNAGIMHPPNGSVSAQGYEAQFGTNVMGHQLLLDFITPLIERSASSGNVPRVVFLSSFAHHFSPPHGGLSWNFKDASKANSQPTYGQSKTGNIYQSAIYAASHPNVVCVSVHPGLLETDLARNWSPVVLYLARFFASPSTYGAYTVLFAALSPKVGLKDSGKAYIGPFGVERALRPDIEKGCTDGTAKKLIDWVEKEISPYK